jgi:hypothetical protein
MRQLPIIYIFIRLLAIAPTALKFVLESVEFNIDISIDLDNLDF